MKKITAKDIIELMFLPITDTKVVETLNTLGIEQPSLGEEYAMEGSIWTEGEETSGIAINFEAKDRNSNNGEPRVEQIDFYDEKRVDFPYGLHKKDDFETVVKKMGRKPDFCSKRLPSSKQWVFPFEDTELTMAVHFKPDMKSINTIVIGEFERDGIEEDEFIFPCDELEH